MPLQIFSYLLIRLYIYTYIHFTFVVFYFYFYEKNNIDFLDLENKLDKVN